MFLGLIDGKKIPGALKAFLFALLIAVIVPSFFRHTRHGNFTGLWWGKGMNRQPTLAEVTSFL
jgi:hypothetical protein